MTAEKQNVNQPTDPRINATLRRMQVLREEHQSRRDNIVQKAGSELISNSPESFAFAVTTLVLSGAGVFVASPILAAGATFGLIASVSLLGIQLAGLKAPVRQSDYDQIEQMTSGILGLTFSTVGQLTGGNKGFEKIGRIGSSLDILIDMRISLNDIYASKDLVNSAPELYKYGVSINSFIDSVGIIVRDKPLTKIRSNDSPMTTTNIETDPINVQFQRERPVDESKADNKSKADDAALAKRSAEINAFWEAYSRTVSEIHFFEQTTPTNPNHQYDTPKSSPEINKPPVKDSLKYVPKSEPNPYIEPYMGYESGGGGSLLDNGGSSSNEPPSLDDLGNEPPSSDDLGEGPLG